MYPGRLGCSLPTRCTILRNCSKSETTNCPSCGQATAQTAGVHFFYFGYFLVQGIYATGTGNAGGKGFLRLLPVPAAKADRQNRQKKMRNLLSISSKRTIFLTYFSPINPTFTKNQQNKLSQFPVGSGVYLFTT